MYCTVRLNTVWVARWIARQVIPRCHWNTRQVIRPIVISSSGSKGSLIAKSDFGDIGRGGSGLDGISNISDSGGSGLDGISNISDSGGSDSGGSDSGDSGLDDFSNISDSGGSRLDDIPNISDLGDIGDIGDISGIDPKGSSIFERRLRAARGNLLDLMQCTMSARWFASWNRYHLVTADTPHMVFHWWKFYIEIYSS